MKLNLNEALEMDTDALIELLRTKSPEELDALQAESRAQIAVSAQTMEEDLTSLKEAKSGLDEAISKLEESSAALTKSTAELADAAERLRDSTVALKGPLPTPRVLN